MSRFQWSSDSIPISGSIAIVLSIPARENVHAHHAGLLFSDVTGLGHEYTHLGWHYRPLQSPPPVQFVLVNPDVPSSTAEVVAATCRKIVKMNPRGLPYAFSPASDAFEEDGAFAGTGNRLGLTCATYILAVFHRSLYPLIDYKAWPAPGPEDVRWQNYILSVLEKEADVGRVTRAHIEGVRREVGAMRYRPCHVGAAAVVGRSPARFPRIDPVSRQMATLLETGVLPAVSRRTFRAVVAEVVAWARNLLGFADR